MSSEPYIHAPEVPPGHCKHGMPHSFKCDDCTIERLHAELEDYRAVIREALEALQFALNFVGRPDRRIDAAIEKLKARCA